MSLYILFSYSKHQRGRQSACHTVEIKTLCRPQSPTNTSWALAPCGDNQETSVCSSIQACEPVRLVSHKRCRALTEGEVYHGYVLLDLRGNPVLKAHGTTSSLHRGGFLHAPPVSYILSPLPFVCSDKASSC